MEGIMLVRRHIKEEIEASVQRSASSVQGNRLATLSVAKPLIFYRKRFLPC